MEAFRRELRRDLTADRGESYAPAPRRFGFAAAAALAMAALLVVFIARPAYPAKLHALLTTGDDIAVLEAAPDGTRFASADLAATGTVDRMDELKRLLQTDLVPPERDRDLVRSFYQRAYPRSVLQVNDVEDRIFAVRRFKLNGGQQAVVYTELAPNRSEADIY